jgi:hypothetical protein
MKFDSIKIWIYIYSMNLNIYLVNGRLDDYRENGWTMLMYFYNFGLSAHFSVISFP